MTPRERHLMNLRHERPDRPPPMMSVRIEVARELMKHFGVDAFDEVQRILGTDGWGRVGMKVAFPEYAAKTNGRLEGDFPYAGREYILHDDGTFEDEWGVVSAEPLISDIVLNDDAIDKSDTMRDNPRELLGVVCS